MWQQKDLDTRREMHGGRVHVWTRQFGTGASEKTVVVAVDARANAYVAGNTSGALTSTAKGGEDAFVFRWDAAGELRWTHQFGTSGNELVHAITLDEDANVHVVGATQGGLGGRYEGQSDGFLFRIPGD